MAIYVTQLIMRTESWHPQHRDRFRPEVERILKVAAEPSAKEPPEAEELSYSGEPDYRGYNKCLTFNRRSCNNADSGGWCGKHEDPLLHACDRKMSK